MAALRQPDKIPYPTLLTLAEPSDLLRVIEFPHPTLRHVSKPLKRVDAWLHDTVREMLRVMYESKGVGLAANQVDLPYRLFVANPTGDPAVGEAEHVFINPVITSRKGSVEAEEGCLSLPGLYGPVRRPERVVLTAYNLSGQAVSYELDELFARVVQHEIDHLDGVLFIDKLTPTNQLAARNTLEEFLMQFESRRRQGEIPDDAEIAARLAALESERC